MHRLRNEVDPAFWAGKNVFITGHTGFKGSWLSLWLQSMGASVTGYALPPATQPNLYSLCGLDHGLTTYYADIRDYHELAMAIKASEPDIVFHLAAQPLVRESYVHPIETYEVNVMGTIHVLEAVREAVLHGIPTKAIVNVTSDKCYENRGLARGYKENDRLGGVDLYSSSKACAELATASYRSAFFHKNAELPPVFIATARAGNVIGGGDWAKDRLVPDCMRAWMQQRSIPIRYPHAVRPWQHVLEPIRGYLLLAQQLYREGEPFAQGWNFGPEESDTITVEELVEKLCKIWGEEASYRIRPDTSLPEAALLQLDCSLAKRKLGWRPRWNLDQALAKTVEWYKAYREQQDLRLLTLEQIQAYAQEGERA